MDALSDVLSIARIIIKSSEEVVKIIVKLACPDSWRSLVGRRRGETTSEKTLCFVTTSLNFQKQSQKVRSSLHAYDRYNRFIVNKWAFVDRFETNPREKDIRGG